MTTTPMPAGFDVCAMPLSETATIGAVLISPVERAQRILASYENEDITEPRLKMIDRVARYLVAQDTAANMAARSEEHTSELQSPGQLVCRLLLEKKKSTVLDDVSHT